MLHPSPLDQQLESLANKLQSLQESLMNQPPLNDTFERICRIGTRNQIADDFFCNFIHIGSSRKSHASAPWNRQVHSRCQALDLERVRNDQTAAFPGWAHSAPGPGQEREGLVASGANRRIKFGRWGKDYPLWVSQAPQPCSSQQPISPSYGPLIYSPNLAVRNSQPGPVQASRPALEGGRR